MLPFIDLYCERTDGGFWAEPVNALSNLSFVIAALVAVFCIRKRGGGDALELVLIFLAASIGIGSFLFHTFASPATELMDVVPIWSFVAVMVAGTIYRMTGESPWRTARIVIIVMAITAGVFWLTSGDVLSNSSPVEAEVLILNGSLQYLPAVIALFGFAAVTMIRKHPAALLVSSAAVTFLLSLSFRTVDLHLCAQIPLGTHFMWHVLNGAMVGMLLLALIRHMPPKAVFDS